MKLLLILLLSVVACAVHSKELHPRVQHAEELPYFVQKRDGKTYRHPDSMIYIKLADGRECLLFPRTGVACWENK